MVDAKCWDQIDGGYRDPDTKVWEGDAKVGESTQEW
jgi:hypothetical protein